MSDADGLGPEAEVQAKFVEPSGEAFRRLVEVMARLRTDCPWDREQTHLTLARHLLEETYETLEAIDTGDLDALREELGDLVIQVVFHSNIAFEEGAFTIADVLDELRNKLVRRHPHVFGDVEVTGAEEVKANWEQIKRREKPTKIYEGIPKSLPALARAAKLERRTAELGLAPGWSEERGVLDHLSEELDELRVELARPERDGGRVEAELGDVLFVLVGLANRLRIDPEDALRRMLGRSEARIKTVEDMASSEGKTLESLSEDDRRRYWEQAKREHI
ncbi:MAG: nucleoside triphosphate pyrophosphohydrolase [Actinomycetota bacterium]